MSHAMVQYNRIEAHQAYQRLQLTIDKDDLQTAIVEIKTFLKMFPDVALASNDLAVLYYQAGDKLKALACYEKANRLQPGTPAIIQNLAEFYFVELGWTDDAITMLTDLLKSYPQDFSLLTALGAISSRIGRADEAQMFYRRALELDPTHQGVRDALAALGGPISAAEYRGEAAPAPVSIQTAPVADKSGELDAILARLRSTVTSAPIAPPTVAARTETVSPDELYRQAQAAAQSGDESAAIMLLEQLIRDTPVYPLAHNDLGILYTQAGNLELACRHHELAAHQDRSNPLFAKNLAALYYSLCGRTDEAVAIYTRLVQEYPCDIEVLTALAIISNNNNLKDQARTFIRRVLDFEPWNADARQFLAEL
ncbi:MAG: tetratricopeptide repeat protein [Geobacter sp.]|nr:tetratricopeptide repeat protein [Geobacter sp.]